jgi:hypothetical protein
MRGIIEESIKNNKKCISFDYTENKKCGIMYNAIKCAIVPKGAGETKELGFHEKKL